MQLHQMDWMGRNPLSTLPAKVAGASVFLGDPGMAPPMPPQRLAEWGDQAGMQRPWTLPEPPQFLDPTKSLPETGQTAPPQGTNCPGAGWGPHCSLPGRTKQPASVAPDVPNIWENDLGSRSPWCGGGVGGPGLPSSSPTAPPPPPPPPRSRPEIQKPRQGPLPGVKRGLLSRPPRTERTGARNASRRGGPSGELRGGPARCCNPPAPPPPRE